MMLPTILGAAVWAASPPAVADTRVAVLPPTFEGTADETVRRDVPQAIVSALREAGFDVVDPARVMEASGVSSCSNTKCANMVGKSVRADYVTRVNVRVRDKDYTFDAEVVEISSGEVVAKSSETCELCGAVEASELAGVQATSLQQKIESLTLDRPMYRVTTKPAGARVLVDGKEVGVTPMMLSVEPGSHRLEFEIDGYVSEPRSLAAVEGIREDVDFAFPPGSLPSWPRVTRPMLISGSVLTGLGVAGIASGVSFLVIDGNSYQAKCSGADVDAAGNCRNIWQTKVPGAVFVGVGGAMLATGVGLIVGASVKRKKVRSVDVAFEGTGLSLQGRF